MILERGEGLNKLTSSAIYGKEKGMEEDKKANLEIVTRLAGKVIKATVSELPHEVSEQATVEVEKKNR